MQCRAEAFVLLLLPASWRLPPGRAAQPPPRSRRSPAHHPLCHVQNKLGGGEGVEGLYGSIKKGGMDKVLECMRDKCGLGGDSVIVDIGAGLGRWVAAEKWCVLVLAGRGRCAGWAGGAAGSSSRVMQLLECSLAGFSCGLPAAAGGCGCCDPPRCPLASYPAPWAAGARLAPTYLVHPSTRRPLMHALLEPGVAGARGIEIDRIKVCASISSQHVICRSFYLQTVNVRLIWPHLIRV